ncbi:fimbrial protein [Aquitalea sp.]|uniref:fimbrial protein n=1 Tax=Aquitalea sp. TaxID=1872623 RepID=UPI002584A828|nr:fimbrial protein [Aquitalea sp.]
MDIFLKHIFLKIILYSTLLTNSLYVQAHDGICSYGGSIDNIVGKIDNITLPNVTWTGGANSIPPIWVSSSINGTSLQCEFFQQVTSRMTFTPTTAPTGKFITVNGTSYPIFSTPITGIGYILALNTVGNPPVVIGSGTTFIGNNSNINVNGFKFNQRIQLVSTGTLPNGSITIPSMTLGNLIVISNDPAYASTARTFQLISNSSTLSLTARTCSPTINNIQITFPELFSYKGNIWGNNIGKSFNLGLSCTQGTVNTYMTFSDVNTPGNISNILSLAPTSTASGIGIQIKFNNGNPISYGLDSASSGNNGQFLLQNNVSGLISLPFVASLIQTGPILPGSFTARATFTFSYQ